MPSTNTYIIANKPQSKEDIIKFTKQLKQTLAETLMRQIKK